MSVGSMGKMGVRFWISTVGAVNCRRANGAGLPRLAGESARTPPPPPPPE